MARGQEIADQHEIEQHDRKRNPRQVCGTPATPADGFAREERKRIQPPWIAACSIIGVLYTGLVALVERDWKRLIAYSSLSQVGLMTLGVFALTPVGITGSVLQQINHAISITGLLLIAGLVFDRRRTLEIPEYGGLARITPVLSAVFLLMILSSIGLPALNGFIGQFLILQGLYVAHKSWAAIAAGGMKGHWFWDFAFLNSNYHLEHHYFPGVPFYRLPALQRALIPFYQRRHMGALPQGSPAGRETCYSRRCRI